ncbi:hypothetical protein [Terasakiella pusilla]|uniref:hypothetical protein n=1 Tax=Terasakiella pusilla TaxID=64973 RepID=UPI003AA9114D
MVETAYTQIALSPQPQSDKTQEPTRSADAPKEAAQANADFKMFGDDGLSFWDFVDMINPLQHIPVVSTAYRAITGDEIDPGARMAGGTLYGGPIGLAASAFNVILEHGTGKDAGEHVIAWFDGEEAPTDAQPVYADNSQAAPSALASSFAPGLPASETDAFAAGEASLRMAELEAFMNPSIAKEVPLPVTSIKQDQADRGSASAGTWAAPKDLPPPESLFEQPVKQAVTPPPNTISAPAPAVTQAGGQTLSTPGQYPGFQAKSTHNDSLDALRAFARDVQAQRLQQQGQEVKKPQESPAAAPANPVQTNTSSLSQTQDNAWFADMMSRNMEQYNNTGPKG